MKTEIKRIVLDAQQSFVTFRYVPNWWDKLWRRKIPPNFTERYVTEYERYTTGGYVYYDKDGDSLKNGNKIAKALDREYIKERLIL